MGEKRTATLTWQQVRHVSGLRNLYARHWIRVPRGPGHLFHKLARDNGQIRSISCSKLLDIMLIFSRHHVLISSKSFSNFYDIMLNLLNIMFKFAKYRVQVQSIPCSKLINSSSNLLDTMLNSHLLDTKKTSCFDYTD